MPKKGYKPTKKHLRNLKKAAEKAHTTPQARWNHKQAALLRWQDPKYRKKIKDGQKEFYDDLREFRKFRKMQKIQQEAEKK